MSIEPPEPATELEAARRHLASAEHHLELAAEGLEEPERGAIEAAAAQVSRIGIRVGNAARLATGIR